MFSLADDGGAARHAGTPTRPAHTLPAAPANTATSGAVAAPALARTAQPTAKRPPIVRKLRDTQLLRPAPKQAAVAAAASDDNWAAF